MAARPPGKAPARGSYKPGAKVRRNHPASKKKKSPPAKESFWFGKRTYFLGLSLGLLLGGLGAVLLLTFPDLLQSIIPGSGYLPPGPGKGSKVGKNQADKTGSSTSTPGQRLYEETSSIDVSLKKLDQGLYSALQSMNVPERDINFLKVTHQTSGNRQYDHVLIEVELPAQLTPAKTAAGLKAAIGRMNLTPVPRLSTAKNNNGLTVEIRYEGRHTHTFNLLASRKSRPEEPSTSSPTASTGLPAGSSPPTAGSKPKVAIIIDDMGLSLEVARCFLELDFPVTASILPFQPQSKEVANLASRKGRPVMLHLPMQPAEWPDIDAGPGVLLVSMDQAEIEARVRAALEAVPSAVGVNNHMGSRFTEDGVRIGWVLNELKKRRLFFIDSLTSIRSKGMAEARRLGLPAASRSIFLDNIQEPQAIAIQLKKLVAQARQHGSAIGIGHVYPLTCQTLKREYNYLNSVVDLVPVTELLP